MLKIIIILIIGQNILANASIFIMLIHKCCRHASLQVFEFVAPLIRKLPDAEAQKCAEVVEDLHNPLQCWETYIKGGLEADGDGEEHILQEDEDPAQTKADGEVRPLDTAKAQFNKATGSLLDLLLDLMQGKYFEDCRKLSQTALPIAKLAAEAASNEGNGKKDCESIELVKALCLLVQSFDTSGKSISMNTAVPAVSLLSSLTSAGGEADDAAAAERARVWKLVQAERRKYVTFSVPKGYSKDNLMAAFRSCGKVFQFSGQLNSAHRLFTASADLLVESTTEPWFQAGIPEESAWKAIVEFCSGTTGSTDFTALFDGRMRTCRRIHELWLSSVAVEQLILWLWNGGHVE